MTYYEFPVASLLTDGNSDLTVAALLERKDFQSIVARMRHSGHLDRVENAGTDSEFPTYRGRTALLPCMMREQAARTDYFTLNTFTPLSQGVRVQKLNSKVGDIEWRYQMKVGERMQAYDPLDPVKLYEHMVWSSKKMLRKDRSLARIMMLRSGNGEWSSHIIMAGERVEKYLLMHLL